MRTRTTASRLAVLMAFAVVAVLGSVKWSPATHAQEEERDFTSTRIVFASGDTRPRLGVFVRAAGAAVDGGITITRVSSGGPADEAGIRADDIIVSVGGHHLLQPLAEEQEAEHGAGAASPLERMRAILDEVPEGEAVQVEVDRDGESLSFDVVPERMGNRFLRPTFDTVTFRLQDMAEQIRDRYEDFEWQVPDADRRLTVITDPARAGGRADWSYVLPSYAGAYDLELVELNPGLGAYFGTDQGVLVANADEDSPLGLLPGDVVVAVEGRKVDDAAELRRILRSYTEDEEIEFSIRRDGAETTVVGTINRP